MRTLPIVLVGYRDLSEDLVVVVFRSRLSQYYVLDLGFDTTKEMINGFSGITWIYGLVFSLGSYRAPFGWQTNLDQAGTPLFQTLSLFVVAYL